MRGHRQRGLLGAFGVGVLALGPSLAWGQVAEECQDFAGPPPEGYDEQVQRDFLANYYALTSTFSALHAPIPHEPGRGMIGVDLNGMPPLKCEKRFALNHSKTEDTSPSPVLPQIVANAALPALGPLRPYVGVGYFPPITVLGTTNVVVSGELGVGVPVGESAQVGARFHTTSQKTVGEIATPIIEGDPPADDLYLASTFGFDVMGGYQLGDPEQLSITPYGSVGLTDASTFFYIGDDSLSVNNLHPYLGPVFAVGADGLVSDVFRFATEIYWATGGYSLPDKDVESVDKGARYGNLLTARARLGVEF